MKFVSHAKEHDRTTVGCAGVVCRLTPEQNINLLTGRSEEVFYKDDVGNVCPSRGKNKAEGSAEVSPHPCEEGSVDMQADSCYIHTDKLRR